MCFRKLDNDWFIWEIQTFNRIKSKKWLNDLEPIMVAFLESYSLRIDIIEEFLLIKLLSSIFGIKGWASSHDFKLVKCLLIA